MAELRSTDIIDKLRKLKKQIDELNIGGVTVDTLQKDGVVFQVNVNEGEYITAKDGIIDLGTIRGLTEEQKNKLDSIEYEAQKNPGRATTSTDGLMGFSDKQKLDNIQFNANYYTIEIIDLRSND